MIRLWIGRLMLFTVCIGAGSFSFARHQELALSGSGFAEILDYNNGEVAFHKRENLQGSNGLTGTATVIPQQAPSPENHAAFPGTYLSDFELPADYGVQHYMCLWINFPIRTGKSNLIYPFHTFW